MDTNIDQELRDRLSLIETMIAEGRQKTESWGWVFVLWGAAYAVTILIANLGAPLVQWTTFGRRTQAWPIIMGIALMIMLLCIAIRMRQKNRHPDTTLGRSIFSVWIAMGISMFLLLQAIGVSGRLDQQIFVAIVCAMWGLASAASSIMLKWRLQFLCAVAWWMASVTSCFGTAAQSTVVLLVAIFLCQIVFGIFCMLAERKLMARNSGAVHA